MDRITDRPKIFLLIHDNVVNVQHKVGIITISDLRIVNGQVSLCCAKWKLVTVDSEIFA